MSIKALVFRSDGGDDSVDLDGGGPYRIAKDELLWLDLQSPNADELARVRRSLRLGDRAMAAIEADPTHAQASVLVDAIEVVVLALVEGLDSEPTALQILVGEGWIMTGHAAPMPFLEEHRERIRDDRPVGDLSPVEFLVSLLDWHVDSYVRVAEELEAEVDKLDDAALRTERDLLDRMVQMRRRIAGVRRILSPHREVFSEIARQDFLPDLDAGEREALAAVERRLERAAEAVAHTREMLIGTFDVHMTRTAQRTNDIMRILTLASVVLLPSVVLAGVMGMNFRVGLFDQANLFWIVVGAMVLMGVATVGIARWRGWL